MCFPLSNDVIKYGLIIQVFFCFISTADNTLTYERLHDEGIVSGFGERNGHPLALRHRISPIKNPRYEKVKKYLYSNSELCIGTKYNNEWCFSPLSVLNYREVINNGRGNSLCFCPLAGLAISVPGSMSISGLLKYDAFLLYWDKTDNLILPYTQQIYEKSVSVPFNPIHLLNYEGILNHFPDAYILKNDYPSGNPYGTYSTNSRTGIGHEKPGLTAKYTSSNLKYHPKERVLIIGFNRQFQKAYPFSELKKRTGSRGGVIEDYLDEVPILINFEPDYQWAYAEDHEGNSLNLAYSYIFSLYQHRPDIEIFSNQ